MENEMEGLKLDGKKEAMLLHCFLTTSVVYFPAMKSKKANFWLPLGGDLSFKAQSMRVAAMNSVWLREEGDGELQEMNQGQPNLWRNLRDRIKRESGMTINPILGFNLEGVMSSDFMNYRESLKGLGQMDMAHDLEESLIESADGKKRPHMDSLDPSVSNTADLLVSNDEQSIVMATAKGQADRSQ
ncbi:hypothetical protein Goari_025306 [Gossypium aridum]|uniref:Uncharacterized protein n=1 Tax=Gossypium aridum TaxID=34290 RepID=A0A7J8XA55_GOSAI|nr:hypothetical protein [Gossypium aridum]